MLAVTAPLEDGDGRIESSIPTWLHSKTVSQIKGIETRHETQLRETRSTWKNMGEICVCAGGVQFWILMKLRHKCLKFKVSLDSSARFCLTTKSNGGLCWGHCMAL